MKMEILNPFLKLLFINFLCSQFCNQENVIEIFHLDVTFQVLGNKEMMEQIWSSVFRSFSHLRKFLRSVRSFSSPFAGALTPCLTAALGPECLLCFLTAVEQVCICSKTVGSKLEQAGFKGIEALMVSMKEEEL